MTNMSKVKLNLVQSELSRKDKTLPIFLYRAFKGEPQDVVEVSIDNVNGCPVSFSLEDASSTDGQTLNGWLNANEYDILVDLMDKKRKALITHS